LTGGLKSNFTVSSSSSDDDTLLVPCDDSSNSSSFVLIYFFILLTFFKNFIFPFHLGCLTQSFEIEITEKNEKVMAEKESFIF
jgi:hypothetical protein